ncbi:MAG: Fe-S cluster assembly protein SufD [Myxococcota bacterium]|nr:Fe-S cluster assembly protein SufD [Myxococcota bacterium]
MSPRANPVYTARVPHYEAQHEAFAAARTQDPGWLVALRADAIARFAELGFPSTKLEEWRYTNVAPLAKLALELQAGESSPDIPPKVGSILDAKDRPFALLNTAFVSKVSVVTTRRNESRGEAVRLDFEARSGIQHPRAFIQLEEGSRATVVIDHSSGATAPGLTNLVVEADVGANAHLELVFLQREDDGHFHVSNVACRVARNGHVTTNTLTVGGALVRNDLDVLLADEGASCDLRGLFIGEGLRLVDNHTCVDHAMPHCSSREVYKGILGDRSKGIFRGRVIVRPDAQKTDATQSNPNLLLGEGAEIDTKPQLEIYADDVRCAHGATVGQLDEEALFYLRSRGLGREEARSLLVHAFANEIVAGLPEAVGEFAGKMIEGAVQGATE